MRFIDMLKDATLRIVRAERRNVMAEARKQLRDLVGFNEFIEDFYSEKNPPFVRKVMEPILLSLMETIHAAASEEIGASTDITPEMSRFMRDYVDGFVRRYNESSRNQIVNIVRTKQDTDVDLIEALDTRFDEWEERRPRKVADRESVQAAGAISRSVFLAGGFALVWVASGSDPCPICQELDGKVVGREGGNFVEKGEGAEGKDKVISPSTSISHPPIHDGCDCQIVPE